MEQLNLTPEQLGQIAELEKETKAKLDKILTPEQQKILEESRPPRLEGQGGPGMPGGPGGRAVRRTGGGPRGGPGGDQGQGPIVPNALAPRLVIATRRRGAWSSPATGRGLHARNESRG